MVRNPFWTDYKFLNISGFTRVYMYLFIYTVWLKSIDRDLSSNNSVSKHHGTLTINSRSVSMLKNMISIGNTTNGNCRICKKTFCCAKCRDRHVDTVHPDLNGSCFLCACQALPMQQFESENLNSEDEQLLCHIIDKHLPLHCQLCGDTFESREDFKSFGNFTIIVEIIGTENGPIEKSL